MRIAAGVLITLAVIGLAAIIFLWSGLYNIAASRPHTRFVIDIIRILRNESVKRHSQGIVVPRLDEPAFIKAGSHTFRSTCRQCHAMPRSNRDPFALGLNPDPPDLTNVGSRWTESELFWIVKNGFKMTGMASFEPSLQDREIWNMVAYLETLKAP